MKWLSIVAGVAITLVVVYVFQRSLPNSHVGVPVTVLSSHSQNEQTDADALGDFTDTDSNTENSETEQQQILNSPEVKAYLALQERKKKLKDYFNNPNKYNADDIYQIIQDIEDEGRVLGIEAFMLKVAWLEKTSTSESEFEERKQALLDEYRNKAINSAQSYKVEDVPGFQEYKTLEASILEDVNDRDQFPNGMTKQEYLRERLLKARIQAYGGVREE